jgi:hypothetical protein
MKLTKLLILFLFLSLKAFSQQNTNESNTPKFTLKYTNNVFCYGSVGESKPTVLNSKGEIIATEILQSVNFSHVAISGLGNLTIDSNGVVNQQKSDVGIYSVILKIGNLSSSYTINVKKCK